MSITARIACSSLPFLLVGVGWSQMSAAGEIPGLPGNLPPTIAKPLEINFTNDILGRGGAVDDFRTQQFIVSGEIGDRWVATLDHSILTYSDEDAPGRIDQLAISLGRRFVVRADDDNVTRLDAGLGLRSNDDFRGERIQNGFHRLFRSSVETLPYTDDDRTDLTAWVDTNYFSAFRGSADDVDAWHFGYWLRGSALATTDGQLDAAVGAYAVAGRGSLRAWLGLRRDWRSGYELPVLAEVAAAEDDLAAVLGVRWGPVVFETVQQFDNKASYGQVRLIASGFERDDGHDGQATFGLDAGVLVPDVHAQLTGRYRPAWLNGKERTWRRSILVTGSFGEPQFGNDTSLYVRSRQLDISMEWERRLRAGWTSFFASIGAGVRSERLVGDVDRDGQRSGTESRGVALISLGVRFDAAEFVDDWNYRLQIGLSGWVPFDDAEVSIESELFRIQRPTLALNFAMLFSRFTSGK